MSYILDALKKSEKERRRGSIPDPLTMQEPRLRITGKRSLWPYLIIFALILNAAVLVIWSGVLHPTKPVRTTETISGMPEAIRDNNPSLSATAGVEKSEVTEKNINRETNQPSEPTAANKENNSRQKEFIKNGTDTIKKVRDYQISAGETGKEHSIPPREKTLTPPPAEVQSNHLALPMPNRVYHLNELPLPIRQTLPEFLVSVFLYSDDPASRLVRINGQMMKEGQYLAPGVKLEEIVPAGVIFNYQNYRFLIGPK